MNAKVKAKQFTLKDGIHLVKSDGRVVNVNPDMSKGKGRPSKHPFEKAVFSAQRALDKAEYLKGEVEKAGDKANEPVKTGKPGRPGLSIAQEYSAAVAESKAALKELRAMEKEESMPQGFISRKLKGDGIRHKKYISKRPGRPSRTPVMVAKQKLANYKSLVKKLRAEVKEAGADAHKRPAPISETGQGRRPISLAMRLERAVEKVELQEVELAKLEGRHVEEVTKVVAPVSSKVAKSAGSARAKSKSKSIGSKFQPIDINNSSLGEIIESISTLQEQVVQLEIEAQELKEENSSLESRLAAAEKEKAGLQAKLDKIAKSIGF